MSEQPIRPSCFRPVADYSWTAPSGDEICQLVRSINWPVEELGLYLGYPQLTVSDWLLGKTEIPFSAWAILCYQAGHGEIWKL